MRMEELLSLCHSPLIARVIKSTRLRWEIHVPRMEKRRSAFKILMGRLTEKRPLGRPRCRWENNISIGSKDICANMRNCFDSAQDMDYWRALVNAALNLPIQ